MLQAVTTFPRTRGRWRASSARASGRGPAGARALPGRDRGRRRVPTPDVYRALGQGEMQSGRSLDSLLSAYRIGARVAWRRFSEFGVDAGLAPETLFELAESIFAYIDVLSAESAEGYAAAQSAAAGEHELRRRRLVRMLVREPPPSPMPPRPPPRPAGRCHGRWRWSRSAAPAGDRGSRLPAGNDRRGDWRGHLRDRRPTPTARAGAPRSSGRSPPRCPGGVGLHGRLVAGPAQLRAGPGGARAGRRATDWSRPAKTPGALAPRRPGAGGRARRRPARAAARPLAGLTPAPVGDAGGVAGRAGPAGRVAERLGIHPRPPAIGSDGCASCSAPSSTTPRARFWLELALESATAARSGLGGLGRRRCAAAARRAVGLGGRDLGPERAGGDLVSPAYTIGIW